MLFDVYVKYDFQSVGHKAIQQQRVHALWCMKHECFSDSCVIHDDDQPTADDDKKRTTFKSNAYRQKAIPSIACRS